QAACGGFDDHHHSRHKRQLEHHMENLTGGTPPVRYLPCVVPCKLYFKRFEIGKNSQTPPAGESLLPEAFFPGFTILLQSFNNLAE
ncbi:MAG: hypothetical protein MSA81_09830, partial [Roseburia hominis]|nr:hypothetical protein [Roseburia hominis]